MKKCQLNLKRIKNLALSKNQCFAALTITSQKLRTEDDD